MHKVIILLFFTYSPLWGFTQETREVYQLGEDYFVFKKANRYGIGKDSTDTRFEYDTIQVDLAWDNVLVRKDNKWGLINSKNDMVIPLEYEGIWRTLYGDRKDEHDETLFYTAEKNGKYGTINDRNKVVIPFIYDNITVWVEGGPVGYFVIKDDKMGLVDSVGNTVIPCVYDSLSPPLPFTNIYKAKIGSHIGVINTKNQIIIPFEYTHLFCDFSDLKDQSEKKIIAQKKGKWYYMDRAGKVLKRNIPNDTILTHYASEFSNYDFKYVYWCMAKDVISKPLIVRFNAQQKEIIDAVIAAKDDVFVTFDDVTLRLKGIPDPLDETSLFRLSKELLDRGFRSTSSGSAWNVSPDVEVVHSIDFRNDSCYCRVELLYCKTKEKNIFTIKERIKCRPLNEEDME